MYVNPNHAILCLKQTKVFTINVLRDLNLTYPDGTTQTRSNPYPVLAVGLDVSDALIGTAVVGRGAPPPVSFKAMKIGSTIVTIKAIAPPARPGEPAIDLKKPIQIHVIDCGFKVKALLGWNAARLDQVRDFRGHMFEVSLNPGTGDTLTATSTLEWSEGISEGCCTVWTVPTLLFTKASITGSLSDQGLILDIAFDSVSHTTCGAGDGGTMCLPDQWRFDPIHAFFPIEDVLTPRQVGQFTVIVTRDSN